MVKRRVESTEKPILIFQIHAKTTHSKYNEIKFICAYFVQLNGFYYFIVLRLSFWSSGVSHVSKRHVVIH